MKRFSIALIFAGCLAVPSQAHAFSTIATCGGTVPLGQINRTCQVTFPGPGFTVRIRATPDVAFVGTLEVTVTQGSVGHSVKTLWATGRIQLDGPEFKTVQLTPGTWTLRVRAGGPGTQICTIPPWFCASPGAAAGTFAGVVEV